ncbi:MAG: haloacid dehalogenase family protein [uncultured archaeon A07HR60]|nr:MAG: haloacid dehalogenase family protein [uncultured archaeon A07HR60]
MDLFGLDKFVDSFYGRSPTLEGIEYRKPNPTYLQRAIVDLDARRPLYVGDSNGDIVAAERARIDSVFLRREHRSDYELTSDPTYEGTGLADVLSLIETEALTPVSKQ